MNAIAPRPAQRLAELKTVSQRVRSVEADDDVTPVRASSVDRPVPAGTPGTLRRLFGSHARGNADADADFDHGRACAARGSSPCPDLSSPSFRTACLREGTIRSQRRSCARRRSRPGRRRHRLPRPADRREVSQSRPRIPRRRLPPHARTRFAGPSPYDPADARAPIRIAPALASTTNMTQRAQCGVVAASAMQTEGPLASGGGGA